MNRAFTSHLAAAIVGLVAVVLFTYAVWQTSTACSEAGGHLVHSPFWFKCEKKGTP